MSPSLQVVSERELLQKVSERLVELYGAERVEQEPILPNISRRPDFVVYEEADRETMALVVEVKYREEKSEYRKQRELESLQRIMKSTGAEHGALISPEFDYVFRFTDEMTEPTTLNDLPGATESTGTRPLSSATEVRFLLNRLTDRFEFGVHSQDGSPTTVFQCLLYKLTAERNNKQIDLDGDFSSQIDDLVDITRQEFPSLCDIDVAPPSPELARSVLRLFHGFELDNSPPEVSTGLIEWFTTWSQTPHMSTSLAESLIDLTEVANSSTTTTLDPASRIGTLSRAAAERGHKITSVEKNGGLTVAALLLNELNRVQDQIELVNTDFFEWSERQNTSQQAQLTSDSPDNGPLSVGSYDQILLNPPMGSKVDANRVPIIGEGRTSVRIEEAYVARSLELLSEGGVLVTTVPEQILSGSRSQTLREYILHEFTIHSVITFDESLLAGSSIRGAVLVIENKRSPFEHQFITASVSSQDDHKHSTLREAINQIRAGDAETIRFNREEVRTLLPSQIQGEVSVREGISHQYGDCVNLGEVAEVFSGNRINQNREGKSKNDQEPKLPYLDSPKSTDVDALSMYPRSEANIVAEPDDILVLVKGRDIAVLSPSEPIIPSSRWAIVRPNSPGLTENYRNFLTSELGQQALEANRSGSAIPFISIADLREIPVPDFRDVLRSD